MRDFMDLTGLGFRAIGEDFGRVGVRAATAFLILQPLFERAAAFVRIGFARRVWR
ncbi:MULTISPECIES: hypothetical protein [unclassified Sphingopyxis]|uniref:hypothetical protein n=1 Tax=unclassified Sphingopyxis TaxID=2614943 RepID=UPI000A55626D|nr:MULTISPECIES: hypothetical protein [unclassified Sphingopyxis]